jgi:hypothetical protein
MAERRWQVLHLAGNCFLIVISCIHRGNVMFNIFLSHIFIGGDYEGREGMGGGTLIYRLADLFDR